MKSNRQPPRLGEMLLPLLLLAGMIVALTVVWDGVLLAVRHHGDWAALRDSGEMITAKFFQAQNLGNILRQNAHYGILAVGMTLVIITGGIDLSVGSLLAFASVVMAAMIAHWPAQRGAGFALAVMAAGLAAGTALGLANGLLITSSKALPGWAWSAGKKLARGEPAPRLGMIQIQPFIVTLAMMSMARGLAFLWTGGRGIDIYGKQPPLFALLGRNLNLGVQVPWPGIAFLLVVAAAWLLLTRTRFGRFVYAIGSNETAALLSGIPVARVKVMVYGLCGTLCGLAAMIYTSVQNSGRPDDGVGFELDAIAAAVIGGASLSGGRGGVGGTLIGALIIGVLNIVLALRGIDPNLQRVLKGAIIIAAVLLQKEQD
jgi:ribose transport system permease protein